MNNSEDINTLIEAKKIIKNFIHQQIEKDNFLTLSLYTQAYELLNSIIINNPLPKSHALHTLNNIPNNSLKELMDKAIENNPIKKPSYEPPNYSRETLIGTNIQPLSEKSKYEQELLKDTEIKDSTKEEYFEIVKQELEHGENILFRVLNGDSSANLETQVQFFNSVVGSIEEKLHTLNQNVNVMSLKEENIYSALTYFYKLVQLKLLRLSK